VVIELADVRAAWHDCFPRACEHRLIEIFGRIVLVENLAYDFLEKVFHRDDACRAAVLIEHDRHVLLEPLEVGKHVFDFA
jgi:hypothetical protein